MSDSFFDKISGGVKDITSGVAKAVGSSKMGKEGGGKPKGMLRLQRSRTRSAARAGGSHRSKRRSSGSKRKSSGKRRSSKRRSGKRSRSMKGGIFAM
jgi:hypothetical protein